MSCSKVQRCERAAHFQSTLPSYSHRVSFVHQQKNGLEFGRKRYRFALARVEMRQSRIDGLPQAHYLQPWGRLRNPRAHDSRRVYMSQLSLHRWRDQNGSIQGWKNIGSFDEYEVVQGQLARVREPSCRGRYFTGGVRKEM